MLSCDDVNGMREYYEYQRPPDNRTFVYIILSGNTRHINILPQLYSRKTFRRIIFVMFSWLKVYLWSLRKHMDAILNGTIFRLLVDDLGAHFPWLCPWGGWKKLPFLAFHTLDATFSSFTLSITQQLKFCLWIDPLRGSITKLLATVS